MSEQEREAFAWLAKRARRQWSKHHVSVDPRPHKVPPHKGVMVSRKYLRLLVNLVQQWDDERTCRCGCMTELPCLCDEEE